MSDYEFLLKFKKQSVNPEYTTGVANAPVQNPAAKNVQMVSQDSIDADMTDKIVKSTEAARRAAQTKMTAEEESIWTSAWNWVEQSAKATVIVANEYLDIQAVHDSVKDWELDDDNREYAADMSAASENVDNKKYAAVHTSQIKDGVRQLEVAHRHIHNCDEHVRCGYAEHYHEMKPENQAPIAGEVVKCAEKVETAQKVVENISKCDKEVQADVVAQSAKGTIENKNFTREEKGQVGRDIAIEIPELDEAVQAQSFTSLTETMHDYEEVITEVSYQVATNVTEVVKNETIQKLSNSQYQNVQETFTKENIERIAVEYKKSLGIEENIPEAKIYQIIEDTKEGNFFEVKQEVKQAVVEEAKVVTNPFAKTKVEAVSQVAPKAFSNNKEQEVISAVLNNISTGVRETELQVIKQALKGCKSIAEFANIIKECPQKLVMNLFKNISTTNAQELFKHSQNSLFMQEFLLKNNFVDYMDVKNDCNPAVAKALNIFADLEKYELIIEEQGSNAIIEKKLDNEVKKAILKI